MTKHPGHVGSHASNLRQSGWIFPRETRVSYNFVRSKRMTKRIWLAALVVFAAACGGEQRTEDAPATSETMTADTAMSMPSDTMARDTSQM